VTWPTAPLGDAFEFIRNGKNVKQETSRGGLPITRIETIADGSINASRVGYAGLLEDGNERWLLERGDILFSHINSVEHIGKCALYEGQPSKLIHGMNLLALRPKQPILDPHYAYRVLSSPMFKHELQQYINKAVNQASISTTNLKSLVIPLPPPDEQRRIAAILGKADALRRKRKRAVELVDCLTQSFYLEVFGDPVTNPRGLPKITLGELIKVKSGNGLVANDMAPDGSFPVYGGNGVTGYHDQFMFESPKLVIGRVGVYCGAVHLTQPNSWVTDNALYVAELKRPISEVYLRSALIEANLNQYAGRAAQPLISGSRIYPVEILLPTNQEQAHFEKAVTKGSRLAESVQAGETSANLLFSSLQSRAFSGQL
jgi:type I restriction enzyme, S subunit